MKFLVLFALFFVCVSAEGLKQNHLIVETDDGDSGRIIKGKAAALGQFPYQVGLLIKLRLASSWCGGSLIHSQWVLTAAHCLNSAKSLTVYLGATLRLKPELAIVVPQANLIFHKDFNKGNTAQNDIGLIKLPKPVFPTRRIQWVDLPTATDAQRDLSGELVLATGWGKISDKGNVADHLQYASMIISDGAACKKMFKKSFTENNICIETDADNHSTCSGDSGGPLVHLDEGVQVGIVSYGSRSGCEVGHPIGFTKVASFIDWINEQTGLNF